MNSMLLTALSTWSLYFQPAAPLPPQPPVPPPADPAISYIDAAKHLWVMNNDTSNRVKIVAAVTSGGSFSPDGTKLVYERPSVGIYTINADGTGATMIRSLTTSTWTWGAQWSPGPSVDGLEKIAFTVKAPILGPTWCSLCIMNTDGTGLTVLTDRFTQVYQPTWNPTSDRIAVWFGNKVYTYDLVFQGTTIAATNKTMLNATGPLAAATYVSAPCWGPNDEILVCAQVAGSNVEIWRIPAGNPAAAARITNNSVTDSQAAWNFDASQVIFGQVTSTYTLLRMNPSGQNVQTLLSPATRPNCRRF